MVVGLLVNPEAVRIEGRQVSRVDPCRFQVIEFRPEIVLQRDAGDVVGRIQLEKVRVLGEIFIGGINGLHVEGRVADTAPVQR